MADDCLDELIRAEDIILGALGFDAGASLVKINQTSAGFAGIAKWPDGEEFAFESEDPLSELEQWALKILMGKVFNGEKDRAQNS